MSEFDRLVEYFTDEANEANARGIGVSIVLVDPDGREERIERPAALTIPLLTPRQREILAVCRDHADREVVRRLGLKKATVLMTRLRAAGRMGVPNVRHLVIREAIRLGEIPPS